MSSSLSASPKSFLDNMPPVARLRLQGLCCEPVSSAATAAGTAGTTSLLGAIGRRSAGAGEAEAEAGDVAAHGDFFHRLSDEVEVVEAHQASDRAVLPRTPKTNKKKAKVVAPPSASGDRSEQTQKKRGRKAQKQAPGDAKEIDDALKKLDGGGGAEDDQTKAKTILSDFIQKMTQSDAKTAGEIVDSAVKKSKGKAPKDADGEQGQDDDDLRERLQKLLREHGGEDEPEEEEEEEEGRKPKQRRSAKGKNKAQEPETEEDESHNDFVKLLTEERERKHEHTLPAVKEEFKQEFGADARQLLCSGCKLVSARLSTEHGTHDVHEAESPAHMLKAKRKAIDAACGSFRHLHVVAGEDRLRFEPGELQPGSPGKAGAPQRLCTALLEEYRFEMLTHMIQQKVPEMSLFHGQATKKSGNNWERWLCANKARLCKRTEVKDDDEDEEL